MTITSSGARCDVCGNYILSLDPEERVHPFKIKGITQVLHCDNACKKLLEEAGENWENLPEGPLRKAFEEHSVSPN